MAYIGRPPEYGGYEKQVLTTDGSTTTFALNYSVGSESSLLVSVAGVNQQPSTAYTLSGGGANVVFSVAPASTATTFVIFLGYAFDSGTLLGTGTITGQTALGAQPATADKFLIYDNSASALKKVDFSYMQAAMGDITGVTAGTGLSGGGTSGTVTLNVEAAQTQITSLGTIASLVATTADINAGTFDGIVGGTTPAAGTFTTFTSTGIDDNSDATTITLDTAERATFTGVVALTETSQNAPAASMKQQSNELRMFGGTSGYTFYDDAGAVTHARIDAAGLVGIGTASPTELLSITGTTPRIRLDSATTSDDPGITLTRQGSATLRGTMYYASSAGNLYIENGYDSAGANILFRTRVGGTPVDVLTLKGDGEVKVTGQAYFADTTLTFDATQDWDLLTNQVCTLTLTANTTFDAPTNMIDGAFYNILMIQDGTGSRTASWNTVFKWAGGTAPTLTTTASAKDIFVFRSDGTNMYEVGRQLNVS